jgi:hypothetical protein
MHAAMLGCVPMASMLTMRPWSAKVSNSCGIAVFALDFSAVAYCPKAMEASAAKALTM